MAETAPTRRARVRYALAVVYLRLMRKDRPVTITPQVTPPLHGCLPAHQASNGSDTLPDADLRAFWEAIFGPEHGWLCLVSAVYVKPGVNDLADLRKHWCQWPNSDAVAKAAVWARAEAAAG